jgi:excisionase family DNA binding protein
VSVSSTRPSDYGPHGAKPLTVTVGTAKELSGLGNTTIWALIKDRTLETVQVGRRRLIIFRSLEALLAPRSQPQPRRGRGRPRKYPASAEIT